MTHKKKHLFVCGLIFFISNALYNKLMQHWDGKSGLAHSSKLNTYTGDVLDLRNSQLGPDGCRRVCKALECNPYVRSVHMQYNCIGDEGSLSVAQLLQVNHRITSIDLASNEIGIKGAEVIAEALSVKGQSSSLLSLDFTLNKGECTRPFTKRHAELTHQGHVLMKLQLDGIQNHLRCYYSRLINI